MAECIDALAATGHAFAELAGSLESLKDIPESHEKATSMMNSLAEAHTIALSKFKEAVAAEKQSNAINLDSDDEQDGEKKDENEESKGEAENEDEE